MDPFGVLSFVIDNAERFKIALVQVRHNEESLVSLTTQVATSLEDLEDIFKELQTKGQGSMPTGLQQDLERMRSGLVQSTGALLLLMPAGPQADKSRLRQLLGKSKQLKNRNEVSGVLHRVDNDMQALLRRFSTKWTAAVRLEVAEGSCAVREQAAATQAGLSELHATLRQLTGHVQDGRKEDAVTASEEHQSQTYLRHRLRKVEMQLASFQASSKLEAAPQPGDPAPWQPKADLTGDHQGVLDRTVDSLVKAADTLRDKNTTLVQVFGALLEVGVLLRHACLVDDSLYWNQQAIKFARLLVLETETNFARAQLARLLRNQCSILRHLDQEEAALASASEALALFSVLFIDKPAIYRADLARSLQTVSSIEAALGNHEAALAIGLRSVEEARQLAADGAAGAQNLLRDALNSLSRRQSACGYLKAALLTMEEVVASTRIHLQSDPAQHNELVFYLNNLACRQLKEGQDKAALMSMRESISLYRPLYEARPDYHRPGFIASLNALSTALRTTGEASAALDAASEAAALCRLSCGKSPAQHLYDSAHASLEMAEGQFSLGWSAAQVLETTHEAVAFCRSAAREKPKAYAVSLVVFLRCLAAIQAATGQLDAASATVQEALELWRSTSESKPGSFAALLYISAMIHSSLGREGQAKAAREEYFAMIHADAEAGACAAIVGDIQQRERRARSLGQDAVADAAQAEREAVLAECRARKVVDVVVD